MFDEVNKTISLSSIWSNSNMSYYNDSDAIMSSFDKETLECPTYSKEDYDLRTSFTYWVDGVVSCITAISGLIANIISAMILSK